MGTFALRFSLLAPIFPHTSPYLAMLAAVLAAAVFWGREAACFAAFLACGLVTAFALEPFGDPSTPRDLASLVLFLAIAGAMIHALHTLQGAVGAMQAALDQVRAAERHKALLLGEFRHRSRNDLQNLVALLRLREREVTSADGKAALRSSQNHALSLARVHTRLADASPGYESEAVVDTRDFVCGLVADLNRALLAADEGLRPIALHADAERYQLPTERAVSLGMLLNELVTNALKHAFPGDRHGTIHVRFRAIDGQAFELVCEDDGMGIADDTPAGTGTRHIRGLTAQLRGTLERASKPDGGTRARVTFPVNAPTILPMLPEVTILKSPQRQDSKIEAIV